MTGKKLDNGKNRWDLLPINEIEEVVKVITYGSVKYGDNDWRKLKNPKDRYYAAVMRHLSSWRQGRKRDTESGLLHLAHAICGLLFIMWFERNKK